MALRGDLCDGGSTHHSFDISADWTLSYGAALSAYSGLHLGFGGDALQSQSAFGAGIAHRYFIDGHDRGVLEVKPLVILCV